MSAFKFTQEADGIRVSTDRPGERATSVVLDPAQAEAALAELAGMLGFTVTPTGSSGDEMGVSDTATVEKKDS